MIHTHTFEVGGKTLSLETGRVAKQAGGSVLLGMGDTVLLGTATMSKEPRAGIDFLPLVCDFEERKYAVGKIPGGFVKRGGRPSEKSILISRLIDRPLRPLFPKGLRHDLQVVTMAFSVDTEAPHDALAINAAGAALAVSDIPFNGPVAGVRVGLVNDEFVLFPTSSELAESKLDLMVAGHMGAISMVEAGALEVSEEVMIAALKFAHEGIQQICAEFKKFGEMVGKPKREVPVEKVDEALLDDILSNDKQTILGGIFDPDKAKRESAMDDLAKELIAKYKEKYAEQPEKLAGLAEAVDKAIKKMLRKSILEEGKRPDGRKPEDIRPLSCEVGLLPRVHGSGLFTRGQTQVMTVLTLGMPKDAQIMDTLDVDEDDKRYMHFYNFPPYSVGEVRPLRAPGRREIGHGALAERALKPVVPLNNPDFPYTLLLISEVLESNGSTSMASVCGSTLALMDAGVPISAPVAGIAMGLMSEGDQYRVLTDIQGIEDFSGDMDFKVAGTRHGITALQLDTKLDGIPDQVLIDALKQAKDARFKILDAIEAEIAAPRSSMSPWAPRIYSIQINPEKIGALIGPGGANIRRITAETGTEIDVQQDGRVLVASDTGEKADRAIAQIRASTASVEVGMEFKGTVTRLMGRGAMVEYLPGKEGLVPTDKLATFRLRRPDDVVSAGDVINVRVDEVDGMGRINLTALGLNPDNVKMNDPNSAGSAPAPAGGDRGDRGGFGGRDRDRGRGRDRGDRGDRGGYGGRDRDRDRDRAPRDRAPESETPRETPREAEPEADSSGRGSGEDVNPRFRPRR